jgi:hypothetical protein
MHLCTLLMPVVFGYSPSDGDLAMYDLGGDHWPPQYANGCAVPVTESTHEKQYCIHS